MELKLNRNSHIPLYRQIIEQITSLVQKGELEAGDKLPPERELAVEYGIARGTINKAYLELERNQIIEVRQGSGSFISSRQDVLAQERKTMGLKLIDELLAELSRLGLSPQEMLTLFELRLHELEKKQVKVRIAAIDCNPEALAIFQKQLSHSTKIEITPFLLNDVRSWPEPASILEEYDLMLTTSTHHKELSQLLPMQDAKIVEVAVTPSQQTIIDLATIPEGAKTIVLTESPQFMEIITSRLGDFGIVDYESYFLKDWTPTDTLPGVEVLIVPPSFSEAPELQDFPGQIIPFDYQMQRGSLIYLEGVISEILNAKAK